MKNKTRRRNWLIAAACVFLTPFFLFAGYVRESLGREKNPSAMAKAALQLEFGNKKFVLIGRNPRQILMKSDSHQPLDLYMSSRGWHRVEPIQMGASSYFGKGKVKMQINSRPFTGRYRFYTLPVSP